MEQGITSESDVDEQLRFPQANISAVRAIANVVGTVIGPSPRDKLILEQLASQEQTNHAMEPAVDEFTVASDGERILDALPLEHPVAPIVHRMVGPERPGETDVEGERITDGVSSKVLLAAELLRQAESLIEKGVHPTTIADGYHQALQTALDRLRSLSDPADSTELEQQVARTAMTGNDIGGFSERWAEFAVEAVDAIGVPTEKSFVVRQSQHGSIDESRLVKGAILDRNGRADERMPERIEDATVLIIGGTDPGGLVDPELRRGTGSRTVTSPDELGSFDSVYADRRTQVMETLVDLGVDVVVTHQGISPEYQEQLIEHDIIGIRGVNTLDLEQLAMATDARVILDPTDVEEADLGYAGLVEETEFGTNHGRSRQATIFDRCDDPESVVAFLCGVSGQIAEYATTEIRKGAYAVSMARGLQGRQSGVVPGAGAAEIQVAAAVRERARRANSRTQLAIEGFADALEQIPATLAHNCGADQIDAVAELRARNSDSEEAVGFVGPDQGPVSAADAGVIDPVAIRRDIYVTAVEVANLVVQVDDAIDATFTDDGADPGDAIYEEETEKQQEFLDTGEL